MVVGIIGLGAFYELYKAIGRVRPQIHSQIAPIHSQIAQIHSQIAQIHSQIAQNHSQIAPIHSQIVLILPFPPLPTRLKKKLLNSTSNTS